MTISVWGRGVGVGEAVGGGKREKERIFNLDE